MSWTTYFKNSILNHMYGDPSFTAPSVFLALSTSTPNVDGTGVTEPVGNNYSRTQILAASMSAAAAGAKTNSADIVLPTPSGAWGLITHLCGYDASSGGNLLWFIDSANVTVSTGNELKVPAGALIHTFA